MKIMKAKQIAFKGFDKSYEYHFADDPLNDWEYELRNVEA